jgi:hypothetical protein
MVQALNFHMQDSETHEKESKKKRARELSGEEEHKKKLYNHGSCESEELLSTTLKYIKKPLQYQ